MERKLNIKAEVLYGGSTTDYKNISSGCFTVGDINSIGDCINKVEQDIENNLIAIQHAAGFFNIDYRIVQFRVEITDLNGEVIEYIEVNNEAEVNNLTKLIKTFCYEAL